MYSLIICNKKCKYQIDGRCVKDSALVCEKELYNNTFCAFFENKTPEKTKEVPSFWSGVYRRCFF